MSLAFFNNLGKVRPLGLGAVTLSVLSPGRDKDRSREPYWVLRGSMESNQTTVTLQGKVIQHPEFGEVFFVPIDPEDDEQNWGIAVAVDASKFFGLTRRDGKFYSAVSSRELGHSAVIIRQVCGSNSYHGVVPVMYRAKDGAVAVRRTRAFGVDESVELYECMGTSSVTKGEHVPGGTIIEVTLVLTDPKRISGDKRNAGVATQIVRVTGDVSFSAEMGARWMPIDELLEDRSHLDDRALGAFAVAAIKDPVFALHYGAAFHRIAARRLAADAVK